MANVLVNDSSLADIADAIREKNGTEETYKPAEMGAAIRDIESGGGDFVGIKYSDFDSYRGSPRVADARSLPPHDAKKRGGYDFLFASGGKNANAGWHSMLEAVYLPNGLIQLDTGLFMNTNNIKNIICDFSAITKIANQVFQYSNIERFDYYIPNLTSVGANVFGNCANLKVLTLRTNNLVTLSNANSFSSSGVKNGTGFIYVPKALIETYKTATNWVTYANQFRALEDYTVDGTITGELDESKI